MKYRVYQDGVSIADHVVKNNISASWGMGVFDTKEEAQEYCARWAYPVYGDDLKNFIIDMEIGKEYNMSFCEIPVMMKIEMEEA